MRRLEIPNPSQARLELGLDSTDLANMALASPHALRKR